MARDKKGEGFHSAAGLIRYFDQEDDKAIPVPPWAVVGLAVGTAVVVQVLQWQFA